MPSYGITVHKSQGQTLHKVHFILGNGCFASGQLYTALSRVRNLSDITFDRPVGYMEAMFDQQILAFYEKIKTQ